jgi:hypothetical protein
MNAYENNTLKAANLLGENGQDLRMERNRQLSHSTAPPPLRPAVKEVVYPNVYRSFENTNVFGKATLPVGTIRNKEDSRNDEIIIPFPEQNLAYTSNLITIGIMEDEVCKSAFQGYKTLTFTGLSIREIFT